MPRDRRVSGTDGPRASSRATAGPLNEILRPSVTGIDNGASRRFGNGESRNRPSPRLDGPAAIFRPNVYLLARRRVESGGWGERGCIGNARGGSS